MSSYAPLLKKLTQLGPRYGKNETKTAKFLEQWLASHGISFTTQPFITEVPVCTKAELTIDGEKIKCMGSSLVSGAIPNGEYLISHFGYVGKTPYNIAYNPMTDSMSVVDHYEVPSITISRNDVVKIVMGKNIKGLVKVKKTKVKTENILVGNIKNPQNIVFAHFDSIIGEGAVDNAGSVAVMVSCILNNKKLLDSTLCILSGNEEMAYDSYKLSGYGFRVFEKDYGKILRNAKQIIVMDGLGVGDPSFSQNGLDWVLQIKMLYKIKNKVFWMQNEQTNVLKYFHSYDDTLSILDEKYLSASESLLKKALSK